MNSKWNISPRTRGTACWCLPDRPSPAHAARGEDEGQGRVVQHHSAADQGLHGEAKGEMLERE